MIRFVQNHGLIATTSASLAKPLISFISDHRLFYVLCDDILERYFGTKIFFQIFYPKPQGQSLGKIKSTDHFQPLQSSNQEFELSKNIIKK